MTPAKQNPYGNEGSVESGNNPPDTVHLDSAPADPDDASASEPVSDNQPPHSLDEDSESKTADAETVLTNARAVLRQCSAPMAAMRRRLSLGTAAQRAPTFPPSHEGSTGQTTTTPTEAASGGADAPSAAGTTQASASLEPRVLTPGLPSNPRPIQHVCNIHSLSSSHIFSIAGDLLVPALKQDLVAHMLFPFLRNVGGLVEVQKMEVAVWWLKNLVRMSDSGRYTMRHS
ncbi:hypothetical protein B0I37DRAFT_413117 [Chaetomium sp. MPI-CAGE-AT-0009]|nr:hypothetical protein B0I37DRAFT_413117 [Chaetomium sp. MPI-CAGE-AT-0009]